jgi:hypothetical protein
MSTIATVNVVKSILIRSSKKLGKILGDGFVTPVLN